MLAVRPKNVKHVGTLPALFIIKWPPPTGKALKMKNHK
ncbi:MAG: hypothetical protein ACI9HY_004121, partial [Planctomycetaceae bacterium]